MRYAPWDVGWLEAFFLNGGNADAIALGSGGSALAAVHREFQCHGVACDALMFMFSDPSLVGVGVSSPSEHDSFVCCARPYGLREFLLPDSLHRSDGWQCARRCRTLCGRHALEALNANHCARPLVRMARLAGRGAPEAPI